MKIGILTFHSQLNYGGVLQCWALQTALKKMGHEVVVIDRWLTPDNWLLDRGTNKWNVRQWVKFWVRSLLGLGDLSAWRRIRRTKKFIDQCLNLTPYHFVEWGDAPKDLGVDLLVVGSDQVWHCGDWGDPRVYLLEGAPQIPAIAYAASFGMTEIPYYITKVCSEVEVLPLYKAGLAKFKALSCRESEGVELCSKLGVGAVHVVDPTLLLDVDGWHKLIAKSVLGVKCRKRQLLCYFLSEDVNQSLPMLNEFAEQNNYNVDVFVDQGVSFPLPMPVSFGKVKQWFKGVWSKWFGRVKVRDSAGPLEFISALASADGVVSDSFHALMFSIIFKKNVRILKPSTEGRRRMFSRIEEFTLHMKGPVISDDITDALQSLSDGETVLCDTEWLNNRKKESVVFLQQSLNIV